LEVFGQSIRESNCDCDRSNAPSLLQLIYLRNDVEMHERLADKNGWVAQACEQLGVPGPTSPAESNSTAAQRRAEAQRKQLLNQIERFNQLPEIRQSKMQPQLQRDYKRMVQRLEPLGYAVPTLESLIADVDSWTMLETPSTNASSEMTLEDLVEEAYLRSLSRFPDCDEASISVDFINESDSPAEGVQSLLWALVNTKEFIITH
jgi:hypothetical protein